MPTNFGILAPLQQQQQPLMGQLQPTQAAAAPQEASDIADLFKGIGQLKEPFSSEAKTAVPMSQDPQQNQQVLNNQIGQASQSIQNPIAAPASGYQQKYYDLAQQHLGENETKDAPVLMSFFQKTLGQNIDPQTTPWCAYYANAVLKSGGVEGTGSGAARSFLNWGTETKQPTPGDIVVLSRGNDPTKGHVGFFAGYNDDGSIKVLGGNQGNSVSVKSFPATQVLGFRQPPNGKQIQQAVSPPDASPQLAQVMRGIAHVESQDSNDPYNLVSKPSRNGDRAYGKYQIMGNNIPSWTKEALGTAMTPQQFMASPEAQEKTAAFHLNKSLQAGYSPQDTASIWFSGRPQSKAGNARDAYGTTVPQYVNKFNQGYKQGQPTETPQQAPQMQVAPNLMPFSGIPEQQAPQPMMTQNGVPGASQGLLRLADSSNPNLPPNIRPFRRDVPIRQLSPQEQAALMRWNGQSPKPPGILG